MSGSSSGLPCSQWPSISMCFRACLFSAGASTGSESSDCQPELFSDFALRFFGFRDFLFFFSSTSEVSLKLHQILEAEPEWRLLKKLQNEKGKETPTPPTQAESAMRQGEDVKLLMDLFRGHGHPTKTLIVEVGSF